MSTRETEQENSSIGEFYVASKKPLWIQLKRKVKGLGFVNSLAFIRKICSDRDPRSVRLQDLTSEQRALVNKYILQSVIPESHIYYANKKKRNLTESYNQQSNLEQKSYTLIGSYLTSQMQLDIKRLSRINCYIGSRHGKYKVHGQRTKSTGRKNKIQKGFQKKKILLKSTSSKPTTSKDSKMPTKSKSKSK